MDGFICDAQPHQPIGRFGRRICSSVRADILQRHPLLH